MLFIDRRKKLFSGLRFSEEKNAGFLRKERYPGGAGEREKAVILDNRPVKGNL
jgi:hypothetical protein